MFFLFDWNITEVCIRILPAVESQTVKTQNEPWKRNTVGRVFLAPPPEHPHGAPCSDWGLDPVRQRKNYDVERKWYTLFITDLVFEPLLPVRKTKKSKELDSVTIF